VDPIGASSYAKTSAELLQQRQVVVARNAEEVPDTCLLDTAKQEVTDFHPLGGVVWTLCVTSSNFQHYGYLPRVV